MTDKQEITTKTEEKLAEAYFNRGVSYRAKEQNERAIQDRMGIGPRDKFASWSPLYHDMGLIGGLLQPLYSSIPLVLCSPRFFLERPLRWPQHWRRFVGRRARVRARGLAGRPEVDIAGVPDDAHVALRLPDGALVTIALADVTDATLVVDWTTPGRPH